MRITTAVYCVLILLVTTITGLAYAELLQLKGNMFINAMKGNTLSGKTGDGVGKEEYFFVTLDGRTVTWKGKTRAGTGMLRGSIVESFLEE